MATANVIFVGPPKYNLHLRDIPVEQHFQMDGGGIRNLHPYPGEPQYLPDRPAVAVAEARSGEILALISRLPGVRGGEIFVLAGNWTAATESAVQYVTQPEYATDLANRIRLPSGAIPRHYQVVLMTKFKDGVPLQISYLTHRVLSAGEGVPRE